MVSFVPVRKRRRLGSESCVRLGEGTYGKKSLWENLWRACGCSTNGNPEKTCTECQGVYKWLTRFVSREALRISNTDILEMKGANTPRLVYINDEPVVLHKANNLSAVASHQNNSTWTGRIKLKVGSRLSLKCGEFPNNPMEFEVVEDPIPVDQRVHDSSESKTDERQCVSEKSEKPSQSRKKIHESGGSSKRAAHCMSPEVVTCEFDGKVAMKQSALQGRLSEKCFGEPVSESQEQIKESRGSSERAAHCMVPEVDTCEDDQEETAKRRALQQLGIDEVTNTMSKTPKLAEEVSIEATDRPEPYTGSGATNIKENELYSACISNSTEGSILLNPSAALKTVLDEDNRILELTPEKPSSLSSIPSSLQTPELEQLYMSRLDQRIEEAAAHEEQDKRSIEVSSEVALLEETSNPMESSEQHDSNETLAASNKTPLLKPKAPLNPNVLDLTSDSPSYSSPTKTRAIAKPLSIMFIKFGRELTNGRIITLANVAKRKGATVVTKLESNPTYLVVGARVKIEDLCSHLGFRQNTSKLKRTIAERGITLVKPSWITTNRGKAFKPPTFVDLYNGLVEIRSPKKRPAPAAAARPPIVQSDDEGGLVSEVPANGGPVIRNLEISELLQKLGRLYNNSPIHPIDEMRAYTFNLVAGRLRLLDFEIKTHPGALEELRNTKGIGGSCIDVIKEWLKTGKIERIHSLETDESRVAFRALNNIWGVGPTTAHWLFMNDYRTLAHVRAALKAKKLTLNENQLIGVECYEDFRLKMTRNEVEQIRDIVKKELLTMLPNAHIELMGSYRRGKSECGDGDLFVTDPGFVNCTPRLALGALVRRLQEKGHIAYNLTQITGLEQEEAPSSIDSQASSQPQQQSDIYEPYYSSQSYMGVFNSPTVPGKRRRVDIKFYPYRERAFASIYFTGCGWFNRSMRLWATRKKNLQLNDHGVFPMDNRMHHVPKPVEKLLLEATSEVEIFDYLGLVYKQPHERNCFDDVVSTEGVTVASLNVDAQKAFREEQHQGHVFRDEDD